MIKSNRNQLTSGNHGVKSSKSIIIKPIESVFKRTETTVRQHLQPERAHKSRPSSQLGFHLLIEKTEDTKREKSISCRKGLFQR
jgi:hypothetical protein